MALQRRRLVSQLEPDEQQEYRGLLDTEAAMIAARCEPIERPSG